MLRFNTSFLLKATTVAAFCCLPMALDKGSGFVWTAFLLPISLAMLAAMEVGRHGPFEFQLKELSHSVVEISTTGGRHEQWLTRARILGAGACLSLAAGFPTLHVVDPEPPAMWLPIVALLTVGAVMLVGCSARRTVLTAERQFVTDYLLFDRISWWRRRWQVREGDCLAVCPTCQAQGTGMQQSPSGRALYVCRPRRRQMVGLATYGPDRITPDLELAANRVAKLVNLPYDGYRE